MSGFEVAGIILGAIPIIVTALQQYKTAKEKLSYFGNKALYIDRLIDSLEEQRVLIETDLYILLKATGVDIGAHSFMSHGQVFQDDEVEKELQDYLGAIYDPYRKALVRCEGALKAIAVKISCFTVGKLVHTIQY